MLLGLAIHPWRAAALGIIGVGLLAAAVLLVSVGYLLPVRAIPALSDEPWLAVVPDVARDQQPVLVAVTVVLCRRRSRLPGRGRAPQPAAAAAMA